MVSLPGHCAQRMWGAYRSHPGSSDAPAIQHAHSTLAGRSGRRSCAARGVGRSDGLLVELHAAQSGLGDVADEQDGRQRRSGTEREHRGRHTQAPAGWEVPRVITPRVAGRFGAGGAGGWGGGEGAPLQRLTTEGAGADIDGLSGQGTDQGAQEDYRGAWR